MDKDGCLTQPLRRGSLCLRLLNSLFWFTIMELFVPGVLGKELHYPVRTADLRMTLFCLLGYPISELWIPGTRDEVLLVGISLWLGNAVLRGFASFSSVPLISWGCLLFFRPPLCYTSRKLGPKIYIPRYLTGNHWIVRMGRWVLSQLI